MRIRNLALLASVLLAPAGCGGVVVDDNGSVADELTVPTAVANMVPVDLAQTSTKLYWTANSSNLDDFVFTASLYGAAKSSVPGQERVIYSESSRGLGATSFGKMTIADYRGVPSAYFFVSAFRQPTYIKRVPLDGSAPAAVVSNVGSLPSSNSPLFCDGTYLYFYGANGLYAAPVDGSAPITVATGTGITALGGFDRAHVYFAVGGYVYQAYKPNYGHFSTSLYTTTNVFTTMYVTAGADNDDSQTTFVAGDGQEVFQWSTAHGMYAWAEFLYGYGLTQGQVQAVSTAGSRLLWTLCDANSVCSVSYKNPNTRFDQYNWVQVQSGARAILGDATQIYFVDNYAIERIPYWQ